jgi:hypothetical protein
MAKALFTATESFAQLQVSEPSSQCADFDRSANRFSNSGARMPSEAWSGSLLGHDTVRSKFGEKLWFILHNQRGRGTDDDCTADDCALGCGGLRCGIGAACWDGDGGADEIFCLMSSSTACSVAMFWAI